VGLGGLLAGLKYMGCLAELEYSCTSSMSNDENLLSLSGDSDDVDASSCIRTVYIH
jgi:hypothetical protein